MDPDASDVSAAQTGDAEAFARLYRRHAAVVLALCYRGLSSQQAEDACQETFLRAYHKLQSVREPEGIRSWLYAIARRVCADRRRSDRRRQHHEGSPEIRARVLNSEQHPPGQEVEQIEQLQRLSLALDQLTDDERLAIHLKYLEPHSPDAAVEALGINRSAYYRLLHQARNRLAILMSQSAADCSVESATDHPPAARVDVPSAAERGDSEAHRP